MNEVTFLPSQDSGEPLLKIEGETITALQDCEIINADGKRLPLKKDDTLSLYQIGESE